MPARTHDGGRMSTRFWIASSLVAAAIAAFASGVLSARAEPSGAACTDLAQTRFQLHRMTEDGSAAVLADLEGAPARRWISIFNAYPPRTAYPGDAVVAVVSDETRGAVLVAFFRDGCELGVGAMPAAMYVAIDARMKQTEPST